MKSDPQSYRNEDCFCTAQHTGMCHTKRTTESWREEFDEEFAKGGDWIAPNMKASYIKAFIENIEREAGQRGRNMAFNEKFETYDDGYQHGVEEERARLRKLWDTSSPSVFERAAFTTPNEEQSEK